MKSAVSSPLTKICLYLCLFLCSIAVSLPTPRLPGASVVVVGGTSTLGAQIVRTLALDEGREHQIYASYREKAKAEALLASLRSSTSYRTKLFELDLEAGVGGVGANGIDIPGFGSCNTQFSHRVLVNCAGVCLLGNTLEALQRSITVNTRGPIALAKIATAAAGRSRGNEIKTTVVNISSGDGELVYINSGIAKDLQALASLEDLERYLDALSLPASFDPRREYAFSEGGTPMYALSKCLLNRATQLLQLQHLSDGTSVRFVAVCPGNFLSPMTSAAEEESARASHLPDVAREVCDVALADDAFARFPGGGFYRHGLAVEW